MNAPAPAAVTLDNCDREPIHVPGAIQPHGAMLAFDAKRRLAHVSANAAELLTPAALPALGAAIEAHHFGGNAALHALLAEAFALLPDAATPLPLGLEVRFGARVFDVVLHRSPGGELVVELELQAASGSELAAFALMAHRAMDRLTRQRSTDALLSVAVDEIRMLTGFDRVMAYRFRHDDSGDVVAESRRDGIDSFVGRRYPASDIPAQARRLYVANTLRLIADIGAVPVALHGSGNAPLDMTGAILRAVSPIHIEYLRNMGVAASMSISIVVDGRLWGLLACHHHAPLRVPYPLRMACDVIGQLLAARVQTLLARRRAEEMRAAAELSARLAEQVLHADDTLAAVDAEVRALVQLLRADAVVVTENGRVRAHGLAPAAAQALVTWLCSGEDAGALQARRADLLHGHDGTKLPAALRAELGSWCGILALRWDAVRNGWIVLLRPEQIETVRWGGQPIKQVAPGPLGPRLTPRGSFDLWQETVRGLAVPWTELELELATQVLDSVLRAHGARLAENDRLRTQLLAMLGHDLRDPLQSITMAAYVLERGAGADGRRGELGARIQSSSSRMQRLVSQVLDVSQVRSGVGMPLTRQRVDIAALVKDLVAEMQLAHPDRPFEIHMPPALHADVDPDRCAQVVSNLLANARHHGTEHTPIAVRLAQDGDRVALEVRNTAPPIAEALLPVLFDPFKRAANRERNRTGLGLGLYLAHEMVRGHGGTLRYAYDNGQVVFTATLPAVRS